MPPKTFKKQLMTKQYYSARTKTNCSVRHERKQDLDTKTENMQTVTDIRVYYL